MEFSFRRLFLAIKRLFVTDSKDIFYNALVLLALGAATPLIHKMICNFDYSTMAFVYACIMIFSCIAVKSFGDFKTKARRCVGILLPCSVLEKYVAEFVYVFVVKNAFLLAALFVSVPLGDFIAGTASNISTDFKDLVSTLTMQNFPKEIAIMLIASCFVYFFGSLCFKKLSLLKTYLVVQVIGIFILVSVAQFLVSEVAILQMVEQSEYFMDFYSAFFSTVFDYVFWASIVVMVFFIVITFFRLKEERI